MFGFFKKSARKDTPETPADEAGAGQDINEAPTEVAIEPTEAPAVPATEPLPDAPSGPAPTADEPAREAEHDAPTEVPPRPEAVPAPAKPSWRDRLKAGLSRTRSGLAGMFGLRKIDEELLEDLESTLLMADCGIEATAHLIEALRTRWKRDHLETADQLQAALVEELTALLAPLEAELDVNTAHPFVIMIAGINGSGKTTSIGKLAKWYQGQGKKVLLAAGDTFRAAAREQLMTWGERNGVDVIAQESGDPAAVVFDAVNAARARNIDIVLADTAGRLPTQSHLMDEIAKVRRVITKVDATAPHEVLLVLDANIGQNALAQVRAFDAAVNVTGLVITKLDGTAKGGVLAAIARQCPKPLRFIGVGEGIDDLRPFHAREFVDALFAKSEAQKRP
ncbi:signal recognition particle-docking protein FtsY [Nitrogeniibacter mangrovi]|uniref:Signal recognition particle receptor FtsY n=1 Tax=Nitrogeniibacter mangrovi TaxID=2016596 RepID=A0A6C1B630_9RHOO|nr:signal recognition particle-docking protein FtsY [Nitrogeniibacter mangrovi]QID18893.1 signal recognition particle-docking protein FtsY [Nitrogeniibacter mangrovi]